MRFPKLTAVSRGARLAMAAGMVLLSGPLTAGAAYAGNGNDLGNGNSNNINAQGNSTANNGTLKVHELGTASGTESNDPKVCAFNFEGFGFDSAQAGYIVLDSQGGQTVTGPYGPYDFGPADNTGYAATEYFNDGSGPVIADGMYKATLYGKSNADGTYSDEKAKSKVFTVDCSSVDETIDPVQPTIDTQASADSIKLGESVTDTATVTGTDANGEVDGTVDFFACGPAGSNPDCSTGGTEVGSGEVGDGNQAVSPEFTPTAAGRYCFRAEYTPADGSNYLAATHTNQTTECFEVAAPVSVGQGGNGDNGGTPSDPGQGGTPAGSGSTPSGGTPSGMPVAVLGASTGPVQVLGTATLPATGSESDLPWLASLLGAMAAYWVSRRRLRLAEVGLD